MTPPGAAPPASRPPFGVRELIVEFFDTVWNRRRLDRFHEFVVDDFVTHGSRGAATRGRDAFLTFTAEFLQAVPDYRIELHEILVDGSKAAVRWTCHGTHARDFFGIPATGRRFSLTGISIYGVRNGKLADVWRERDFPATWAELLPTVSFSDAGIPTALLRPSHP